MMLHEPMLLRRERNCRDGSIAIRATPLRFVPLVHSSAPLIGCVDPAIGPNRSRVKSEVSA